MSADASERVDEEDKFYKGLKIGSQKAEGRSHSRGPKKDTKTSSEIMIAIIANSEGK